MVMLGTSISTSRRVVQKLHIMKTSIQLVVTFLCLSVAGPKADAVNPPPDGGYPGGNTAEGQAALLSLTTGGFNTAVGFSSLRSNTTGQLNTAVGAGSLLANTLGFENTGVGAGALLINSAGVANTATGAFALFSNTGGQSNTATGDRALFSNTSANDNTAMGNSALGSNTTGGGNTAVGSTALASSTGSGNVALGSNAGANVTTASNVTCIGSVGLNTDNSCFIARIFGATSTGGIAVVVNSDGKLGTPPSSRRFKEGIEPMESASETVYALKPVIFRYKREIDPARTAQFGLVAEDVEKVNPDLVVRDKEGKTYSVRYDQVNAMLLNEFLKEHRKVEEQGAAIARQRTDFQTKIDRLEGIIVRQQRRLDEQAAQIEKVSAQMQMDHSAAQMVVGK